MAWYLVFWRDCSTATVVSAASAGQAHTRALKKRRRYASITAVCRANAQDVCLIRRGILVRRRRDGSSPQFGTAQAIAQARRPRSRYRHQF